MELTLSQMLHPMLLFALAWSVLSLVWIVLLPPVVAMYRMDPQAAVGRLVLTAWLGIFALIQLVYSIADDHAPDWYAVVAIAAMALLSAIFAISSLRQPGVRQAYHGLRARAVDAAIALLSLTMAANFVLLLFLDSITVYAGVIIAVVLVVAWDALWRRTVRRGRRKPAARD